MNHGSRSTYVNLGCRCQDCTIAATKYQYEWTHADPVRLQRKRDWMRAYRARLKAEDAK